MDKPVSMNMSKLTMLLSVSALTMTSDLVLAQEEARSMGTMNHSGHASEMMSIMERIAHDVPLKPSGIAEGRLLFLMSQYHSSASEMAHGELEQSQGNDFLSNGDSSDD